MKIVMLVDNGVEGDSRVQKTARSAADAGWDVTLLGISPTPQPQSWRIGRAEVRLLPLPSAGPSAGFKARVVARGGFPLRAARLIRKPWEYARTWYHQFRAGDRAWRRLEPGLWNYERALGPAIDELRPDLLYANDFRMLGVAARAKERAARPVKLIWDVHEFLPGLKPRRDNAYWLPAHCAYEREYAPAADAVVTVSPTLAELLMRQHKLAELPAVVLNAPDLAPRPDEEIPDLREICGVDDSTPLLVYSGAAAAQRGLDTVVAALSQLDGVHLALVVGDPQAPHIQELVQRNDRVHAVPYVPHWQVVPFLSAADAGVIPIHHWPNHELALITKFFEYSHARLPIIVSDVRTMAAMVRQTGQGEVFRAKDVAHFATAARKVLGAARRYREAYDRPDSPVKEWTWAAQAATLDAVYRRLAPAEEPAK